MLFQSERYAPSRGRVFHRVGDQVQQQLENPVAIGAEGNRSLRHVALHREPGAFGQHARRLRRFGNQLPQVEILDRQRQAAFVGTCQGQQTIEQLGHPIDLIERLIERLHALGRGPRVTQGPLDAGAQHHQRRLELVARLRGEAVERREAPLQPVEHAIHRRTQPGDLVPAALDRQPPVEALAAGDRLELADHFAEGLEVPARDPVAQQHGAPENERCEDQHAGKQRLHVEQRSRRRRRHQDRGQLRPRPADRPHQISRGADLGVEAERPALRDDRRQDQRSEAFEGGDRQAGRLVGREEHAARAVGEHEIVLNALEVGSDRRLETRQRVGSAPRHAGQGHDAAEHPVGFDEVSRRELRFELQALLQPLVEAAQAGALLREIERGAERHHRPQQGERVAEAEPPANRAHASP